MPGATVVLGSFTRFLSEAFDYAETIAFAMQPEPHISIIAVMRPFMDEIHPFTFNVVADPLRESRYRWTVCEGNQILVRSPYSYATRREAEKEAIEAVSRRVEHWRNGD